jgi:hypothetical protein
LGKPSQSGELLLQGLPLDLPQPPRDVILDANARQPIHRDEEGIEVRADVDRFVDLERLARERRFDVRQPKGRRLDKGLSGGRDYLLFPTDRSST